MSKNIVMVHPKDANKSLKAKVYNHYRIAVKANDRSTIVSENRFQCTKCKSWVDTDTAKHGTNKLLRHVEKCVDSLVKLNREDILELMLGCLNISGENLSKSKMSAAFEKYNPFRSNDINGFLRDVRFLVHFSEEDDEASVAIGNGLTASKTDKSQPNDDNISENGSDQVIDSESEETNTEEVNASKLPKQSANKSKKSESEPTSKNVTNVSRDVIDSANVRKITSLSKNGCNLDSDSDATEPNSENMKVLTIKGVHNKHPIDSTNSLTDRNREPIFNEAAKSVVGNNQAVKTVERKKHNRTKRLDTSKNEVKLNKVKFNLIPEYVPDLSSDVSVGSKNVDENRETELNEAVPVLNDVQKETKPKKKRQKKDSEETDQKPNMVKTKAQLKSIVFIDSPKKLATSVQNKTTPSKVIKSSTNKEKPVVSGLQNLNNHRTNEVMADSGRLVGVNTINSGDLNASNGETNEINEFSEAFNNVHIEKKENKNRKRKNQTEDSEETVHKPKLAKTNDKQKTENLILSPAKTPTKKAKKTTTKTPTQTPTKTPTKTPSKTSKETPKQMIVSVKMPTTRAPLNAMYQSVSGPSSSQLIIKKVNSSQNEQASGTETIDMSGRPPVISLPRIVEQQSGMAKQNNNANPLPENQGRQRNNAKTARVLRSKHGKN